MKSCFTIYIIFSLLCSILFMHKLFECVTNFMKFETLTNTSDEPQEAHPLPWFCIEATNLSETEEKLSKLSLTSDGYKTRGQWSSNISSLDEESIYNTISSSFEDLVSHVSVEQGKSTNSDAYTTIDLVPGDEELTIKRCDYYYRLKCFCIKLAHSISSHGVQEITIGLKLKSQISVVAPENFYSLARKQARIVLDTGYKYYSISRKLSVRSAECSPEMDWMQDNCKLKYLNQKLMDHLNCTTPWLLHFAKLEGRF